jgi:hypothetical protein
MVARLRHRSKGTGSAPIGPGTLWYRPIGHPIGGPMEVPVGVPAFDCITNVHSIGDVTGAPNRFNPTKHYHIAFYRQAWPRGWTDFNEVRLSTPYPIVLGLSELQDILPDSWHYNSPAFGNFCSDAFYALTDQMPPVVDGLHIVQDLLTLRGLARSILSIFKRIRSAIGGPGSSAIWGRGAGNSFAAISKLLADAHLTQAFGIQPLIREMKTLGDGFYALSRRIQFLRDTQGHRFITHYKKSHVPSWKPSTYFTGGVPEAPQLWIARPIAGRVTYVATVSVHNRLEGLEGFSAELSSFLASFGLGRSASFAWDLVPFSFIIDWLVPVSKWLDKHATISPFRGRLVIEQAGHSIKGQFAWDIAFHPAAAFGNPEQHLGRLVYSSYDRGLGLPADASALLSGSLSAHQLAILASLVFQRV